MGAKYCCSTHRGKKRGDQPSDIAENKNPGQTPSRLASQQTANHKPRIGTKSPPPNCKTQSDWSHLVHAVNLANQWRCSREQAPVLQCALELADVLFPAQGQGVKVRQSRDLLLTWLDALHSGGYRFPHREPLTDCRDSRD